MTTTASQNSKHPWTRGEKALAIVIILVVALTGLGMIWAKRDSRIPTAIIPTPVMPAQNAFDYFNAAANAEVQKRTMGYAEMGPPPPGAKGNAAWPVLTLAQKAAVVNANAPMLRLVRQGLALPYQPPPIRSFSTTFNYTAHFREVARVLAVAGRVQIAEGRWDEATNTLLDDVQMGEKMAHGGTLIGLLVGDACEAIGRQSLWGVVDHLTAPQAEAAARRMEIIQAERVPFAETVQEEKWSGQAGLLEILRRPDWRQFLIQAASGNGSAASGPSFAENVATMFLTRAQVFQDYTRYMDNQLALASKPYAAHAPAPPPAGDFIAQTLSLDWGPIREQATDTEAEDQLLMVMLALRAYHLEQDGYPATLAAIVPKYLARIPNDPFTPSSPLRYQQRNGKYLLYSVGPDGKDDGGKPIFDAAKPAPTRSGDRDPRYFVEPDSQGDIVAGVNP